MQPKPCIYFIYCNGMIKIGQTKSCPKRRMGELQVGCPYPLELAATWSMSANMLNQAERFLHHRFRDQQVIGEWFSVGPSALTEARAALLEHFRETREPLLAIRKNRKPRNNTHIDFDEMWDSIKIHINSDFHRNVMKSAAISKRFELAEIRRALNRSDDVAATIDDPPHAPAQ